MKKILAVIIMTFALGACSTIPAEPPEELVYDAVSDTVFYDYDGGELPGDVITDILHTISIGTTTFTLHGVRTQKYCITFDEMRYYLEDGEVSITSIDAAGEGFTQNISELETSTPYIGDYGFGAEDWNFDGYPDISLWLFPGGSMGNRPTMYWLWDDESKQFIENEQLSDLSWSCSLSIHEGKQIVSFSRIGTEYYEGFWNFENGEYIRVRDVETFYESEEARHVKIYERRGDEMVLIDEYYEGEDDAS